MTHRMEKVLRNAVPLAETQVVLWSTGRVVSLEFRHRVHRHLRWRVTTFRDDKVRSFRRNLRKPGTGWEPQPDDVTKALCLAAFPDYVIDAREGE